MKKFLLLLLFPTSLYAFSQSTFDNHVWYFGTYTLTIRKHLPLVMSSHIYDHSLSYQTPDDEENSTDACYLEDATLKCSSKDTVAYQAEKHAVTLTRSLNKALVYYDKDYQPESSALSGTWQRSQTDLQNCRNNDTLRISIPYTDKEATTFNHIDFDVIGGYRRDATYYLVQDPFNQQLVFSPTPDKPYYYSYYLFDVNAKPITDFSQLNTLAILNDSNNRYKPDPQCDFTVRKQ